jgi:hypothetical protein
MREWLKKMLGMSKTPHRHNSWWPLDVQEGLATKGGGHTTVVLNQCAVANCKAVEAWSQDNVDLLTPEAFSSLCKACERAGFTLITKQQGEVER